MAGYYNQSLANSLFNALSCLKSPRYDKLPDLRNSRSDKFLHEKMAMCSFPGAPFFKLTGRFLRLEKEVTGLCLNYSIPFMPHLV